MSLSRSILYYPHMEISNKEWLKSSLLLWDHIYRIVPHSYHPEDDDEVKMAADAGLLRSITLDKQDVQGFSGEFKRFIEKITYLPAGLDGDDISFLHPDKVDSQLYPYLEQYATGQSEKGFIELPREIVRGYMYFLSCQVAKRRGLSRCTDDKFSFAVSAYFSEDANFDEFVCDRQAVGVYSSLNVSDLLPFRVANIPMDKIIQAANNSKDERVEFCSQLEKFADELHSCQSSDHAATVIKDHKKELVNAKERLKRSQSFMKEGVVGSLFTMGLPTAMTAYGALVSSQADPFGLYAIGSSLAIGAVASYMDYSKAKPCKDSPYGASYLISLEKSFAGTNTYPAFDRYMEEFIND